MRVKVSGHSMEPVIKESDKLLVFKWAYLLKNPRIGDIVVFQKDKKYFVKRIIDKKRNGFAVEGDNKSDSLKLGIINKKEIVGKVTRF